MYILPRSAKGIKTDFYDLNLCFSALKNKYFWIDNLVTLKIDWTQRGRNIPFMRKAWMVKEGYVKETTPIVDRN